MLKGLSHLHKFVVEIEPRVLEPPAGDFLDPILAARGRAAAGRVVPPCHAAHVVDHTEKIIHHACLPSTRLHRCPTKRASVVWREKVVG